MKILKTIWIPGSKRPANLLLILAIGAFSVCGYAEEESEFVALLRGMLSYSTGEKVEMFVPAGHVPTGESNMPATVTIRFELIDGNHPEFDNTVDVVASIGSTAKFDIALGDLNAYGQTIRVNDAQLCCAKVAGLRVHFQYIVKGSEASFLSGGEFPIPIPFRRGDNIAVYYVNGTTGATQAADVVPIAVLDSSAIVTPPG